VAGDGAAVAVGERRRAGGRGDGQRAGIELRLALEVDHVDEALDRAHVVLGVDGLRPDPRPRRRVLDRAEHDLEELVRARGHADEVLVDADPAGGGGRGRAGAGALERADPPLGVLLVAPEGGRRVTVGRGHRSS
jgi:hypothetical protein